MTDYKVSYVFKASTPEEAAQKVLTSLYLADIDGRQVAVEQVNGETVFSYPLIQSTIRQLSERSVKRDAGLVSPPAEGEWNIATDGENRVGDDV